MSTDMPASASYYLNNFLILFLLVEKPCSPVEFSAKLLHLTHHQKCSWAFLGLILFSLDSARWRIWAHCTFLLESMWAKKVLVSSSNWDEQFYKVLCRKKIWLQYKVERSWLVPAVHFCIHGLASTNTKVIRAAVGCIWSDAFVWQSNCQNFDRVIS